MHRKRMIVFCLLPAYMLLVLHGVIPHHHHFAAENGPLSFHHGFNTNHHDHLAVDHHNDADGHGHTAHFVHSPEFGTAMVKPGVNWPDHTDLQSDQEITDQFFLADLNIVPDDQDRSFPESPPRYFSPTTSTPSLRGPPSIG